MISLRKVSNSPDGCGAGKGRLVDNDGLIFEVGVVGGGLVGITGCPGSRPPRVGGGGGADSSSSSSSPNDLLQKIYN